MSRKTYLKPISKAAVIGIAAGAATPALASELNKAPVVGKFMRVFTGNGRSIALKLK